jgi:hypothetical protein
MNSSRINRFAPRILALLLTLGFCGPALAAPPHAQIHSKTQTKSDKAPQPKASETQREARQHKLPARHLHKLVVHGQLKPICVLEWLKVAFKRPYTTNPAKANLPVCRLVALTGSRIKNRILCETSNQLFRRQQNCPGGLLSPDCTLYSSVTSLDAALPPVNVGKLKALLQTVPSHYSPGC